MKRLMLAMMAIWAPMTALAQEPVSRSPEGIVVAQASAPAASQAGAAQTAPAPAGSRRRPSMVGYVEDADISTKVRVRFDSATDLQGADRAEYFYAKCGCYRYLPPSNVAYDPDAPGPGPGVLTSANFQQFNVYGEYAVTGRLSVIGDLPFRSLKPQTFAPGTGSFDSASGLSDLRAGVKLGMATDSNSQTTLQVMASMPSGDAGKGLGTNHASIEPAILYNTELGEHAALEAQFGTVFPLDGSKGVPTATTAKFSGRVIYYGVGPSVDIYAKGGTRVAPVVELFGWHVVDGYSTFEGGPANGIDIVNLKIGGRIAVGMHSIYVGWGKALTDANWYDQLFRLEYRYGF
jgi:hypothetical protein